jgi:hypothetical protein
VLDWQVIRKKGDVGEEDLVVQFIIEKWIRLYEPLIQGVNDLKGCFVTSSYLLDRVSSLAELRIEEDDLSSWRELKRQGHVVVELDHECVDLATSIKSIKLRQRILNIESMSDLM